MTHHAVIESLEEAIDDLADSLEPLIRMVTLDGHSMIITHNNTDLHVHIPISYKAYLPKKFNGFAVEVFDYQGEQYLDMNSSIQNYGTDLS